MSAIHIRKDHPFGLARAREIASHWAEDMEEQYGMACRLESEEGRDIIHFSRKGVSGQLVVTPDHFDLQATLGFLLSGFSKAIEAEVHRNFDALVVQESRHSPRPT